MQYVTASISSCGNHAIATQSLVKNVPPASGSIVHAICRFLQFCSNMVDDLLLVAIDIRHHDSHHQTVLEERLFRDQCGKDLNFCWLPSGSSSEILVLWKQENRSVCNPSARLGNLAVPV